VAKVSAGLLLYRIRDDHPEVLLVHPGGPFWKHRDAGAWSIPKGEVADGEELLAAARREFLEETGLAPDGPFLPLGSVRQKSGKLVHAWAVAGDCDPSAIRSNDFEVEWPPRSGKLRRFPEIDRAEFFDFESARHKLVGAQATFIAALERALSGPAADGR
jgi:predicted NUDIX family NTP pyrophosphohydrolase